MASVADADRWVVYNSILDRIKIERLPGNFRSLERLAELCRPSADGPLQPRVRVGELRLMSPARVTALPYLPTERLTYMDGRPVTDVAPLLYDLSGGVVFANGNVWCDNILSVDEFRTANVDWRKWGWYSLSERNIGFRDFDHRDDSCTLPAKAMEGLVKLPDDSIYFLFHSFHSAANFGHFMHDTLAQLLAYRYLCDKLGIRLRPLMVSPNPRDVEPFPFPMQKFLFEALVAPYDQVIVVRKGPVQAVRCFTTNRSLDAPEIGRISVGAFRHLHSELATLSLLYPSDSANEKLYISRGDVTRANRHFHNIEQFEQIVADAGFLKVTPTDLSPARMVQLMSHARHIVGIHGAGLTNMLFAPDHTRVTEVMGYPTSWPSIALMSAALGFDHQRIPALAPTETSGGLPGINLDQVAKALRVKGAS